MSQLRPTAFKLRDKAETVLSVADKFKRFNCEKLIQKAQTENCALGYFPIDVTV